MSVAGQIFKNPRSLADLRIQALAARRRRVSGDSQGRQAAAREIRKLNGMALSALARAAAMDDIHERHPDVRFSTT